MSRDIHNLYVEFTAAGTQRDPSTTIMHCDSDNILIRPVPCKQAEPCKLLNGSEFVRTRVNVVSVICYFEVASVALA